MLVEGVNNQFVLPFFGFMLFIHALVELHGPMMFKGWRCRKFTRLETFKVSSVVLFRNLSGYGIPHVTNKLLATWGIHHTLSSLIGFKKK